MKRIGVDVGGTFTDLILVDEEAGRITGDKVPSTPDDPARGVVEGINRLCEKAGVQLSEIDNLLHGTTVATNIALTHQGASVGLITTEGFRAAQEAAQLLHPAGSAVAGAPARQAPPPPRRRRARDRAARRDRHAAR